MGKPKLCPVHVYQRKRCTERCATARRELSLVAHALSQYWYDRAHHPRVTPSGPTPTPHRVPCPTCGREMWA